MPRNAVAGGAVTHPRTVESLEEMWHRFNAIRDIAINMGLVNFYEYVNAWFLDENRRQLAMIGDNMRRHIERVCVRGVVDVVESSQTALACGARLKLN